MSISRLTSISPFKMVWFYKSPKWRQNKTTFSHSHGWSDFRVSTVCILLLSDIPAFRSPLKNLGHFSLKSFNTSSQKSLLVWLYLMLWHVLCIKRVTTSCRRSNAMLSSKLPDTIAFNTAPKSSAPSIDSNAVITSVEQMWKFITTMWKFNTTTVIVFYPSHCMLAVQSTHFFSFWPSPMF